MASHQERPNVDIGQEKLVGSGSPGLSRPCLAPMTEAYGLQKTLFAWPFALRIEVLQESRTLSLCPIALAAAKVEAKVPRTGGR